MTRIRSVCAFLVVALILIAGSLLAIPAAQTQAPQSAPSPASDVNNSGGQQSPGSSAPAASQSDETRITFIKLKTSFLTVSEHPDGSCASYVPDYKKYHSILDIVEPDNRLTPREGGSTTADFVVYKANVAGRDPVSGEDRRMGLGSTSFDPVNGTMVLDSLVGEPGTRLTFRGDASHPFAPVPTISVWDGAIDIDPKCGMIIHARSADGTDVGASPASTRSDLASQILRAQRLLKALGYDPGPADGKAGARTVEAIKNFERSEKLPVDGQLSPALLKALQGRQSNLAKDRVPGAAESRNKTGP